MTSRVVAGLVNAALWGSGYIYSGRGAIGILAVFSHLIMYGWLVFLSQDGGLETSLLLWGPSLFLGSLFFGLDGYKYAVSKSRPATPEVKNGFCNNCGAPLTSKEKYCSECGASQRTSTPS